MAFLAAIGMHIFEKRRPARPAVGRSSWLDENADYLLLTEDEFTEWLSTNPLPRVVVIRDSSAKKRKVIASLNEVLSDPATLGGMLVDVQSFDYATGRTYTQSPRAR